jgi:hypothetical protein
MDSLFKKESNIDPEKGGIKSASYINIYVSFRQLPYRRLKYQSIATA